MQQRKANTSSIFKFAIISNILEWYEFCIYGFLATIIAELFFKTESIAISLMYTFFVFSISFIARPLGSIFFGYLADRYSRAISLQIATISMSAPTFIIGLLPTYDSIGISAIILLIILRLIQGFAAGGELPTSACMVYESTQGDKKSWLCSNVSLSALIGFLLGAIVVMLLFWFLDKNTMVSWGWRIPFLFGLPITFIVFLMRNYLINNEEIPTFSQNSKMSILKNMMYLKNEIILAIIIVGFIQTCFYLLFVWFPSYLTTFLHVDLYKAQTINCIGLLSLGTFIFIFGYLTKYFSKILFLVIGSTGMMIIVYPIFSYLPQASIMELILIQIILGIPTAMATSVIFVLLGDLFEKSIRCSGINITYTFGTALIGGTAPAICTYLINVSGNFLTPAYFIFTLAFLSLISAFLIKPDRKIEESNISDRIRVLD